MIFLEKIGQLNLISPPGDVKTGAAVSADAEKYIKEGEAGCCSQYDYIKPYKENTGNCSK